MSTELILPRILKSKTSAQYHIPRVRPQKFYTPRFVLGPDKFRKTVGEKWLLDTDPSMPPYPYGKDNRFPEANVGLYGGATIQSGNKISKGRNKGKTVRKWYPNIKIEKLQSTILDKTLTVPVTARVKRTIEKCGGLDNYILGNKPARIKELGLLGWKLRWMMVNSENLELDQRQKLGLPSLKEVQQTFSEAWADEGTRSQLLEKQAQKWEDLKKKEERFRTHFQQLLIGDKAKHTNIPTIPLLSLHSPKTFNLPESVQEGEVQK